MKANAFARAFLAPGRVAAVEARLTAKSSCQGRVERGGRTGLVAKGQLVEKDDLLVELGHASSITDRLGAAALDLALAKSKRGPQNHPGRAESWRCVGTVECLPRSRCTGRAPRT